MKFLGFSFGNDDRGTDFLPELFAVSVNQNDFVKTELITLYTKILTDVIERTQGLPAKAQDILWDNCLGTEVGDGLITLIAKAMEQKSDLYLVYKADLGTIRVATTEEKIQIKSGNLAGGLYVSFTKYTLTDMLRFYAILEYCVVVALNKTVNLSKALQYKIDSLRKDVGLIDASVAKAQAKELANALAKGKDVMLDKNDEITTHKTDMEPTAKAMLFIESKRCYYLSLPRSYVNGELGGLGDSGKADTKAIDRGLKPFFFSIMKPVLSALFDAKSLTFKSEDFSNVSIGLDALKTFELVSDRYASPESKLTVVNGLLGVESKLGAESPEPKSTTPVDPADPQKQKEIDPKPKAT